MFAVLKRREDTRPQEHSNFAPLLSTLVLFWRPSRQARALDVPSGCPMHFLSSENGMFYAALRRVA